jgi:hypothetical protein
MRYHSSELQYFMLLHGMYEFREYDHVSPVGGKLKDDEEEVYEYEFVPEVRHHELYKPQHK